MKLNSAALFALVCSLLLVIQPSPTNAFIPFAFVKDIIESLDNTLLGDFGYVSPSHPHEDIIKLGMINSIVKYFYDQPFGSERIDLNNTNQRYNDLRNLYRDYYAVNLCELDSDKLIEKVFKVQVGFIDLDKSTKDMPYAHFDAETFVKSNERVMNFTKKIYDDIRERNYREARIKAAQILHTIHDFYSHSNWVEMGNKDINRLIGTANFATLPIVSEADTAPCLNNCRLIQVECDENVRKIIEVLVSFDVKTPITCPLKYYNCTGTNIALLDKLVSGFFGGQTLEDGTSVPKPLNTMKCSHGGIKDSTTNIPAQGGINKDSGFYLFSPRADLHVDAAKLAIKHTEFFFDEIRKNIGDDEFSNFLQLKLSDQIILNAKDLSLFCSSCLVQPFHLLVAIFPLLNIFFFYNSAF